MLTRAPVQISAFESLHRGGYIYAYLKIDSFLVTLACDGCRLVDFGRSRTFAVGRVPRGTDYALSKNQTVASIRYQDGRPIGPCDDIFSAGLLLLYLLQGHDALPWAATPELVRKSSVYTTSGIEDLPPYFRSIFHYCLTTLPVCSIVEQPNYAGLRRKMTAALESAPEVQDAGMWEEDHSREVWNRMLEAQVSYYVSVATFLWEVRLTGPFWLIQRLEAEEAK